ncbi:hypothetical protein F5Y10DRAFT_245271 [Nemania abortiva]|nr:hypothetical protein F5Y10DRAFT_245271 [Nemania abortiva]
MADPLSIAGLATGVVPLGLQLFETVNGYLDAVKGRSSEIEFTRRQADNMRNLLETIRGLLPRLQTDYPTSAVMIQHYVKPCEAELRSLNDILLELCGTSAPQSSILSKLKEQRKKLSYPFDRSRISQLESRLEKVNHALQTALQLAGFDISMNTAQKIRRLHDQIIEIPDPTPTNGIVLLRGQSVHAPSKLRNLNAREAVLKLTSKPSYLRASLDELESSQNVGTSRPSYQEAYICRPTRRTMRQRSRVAALSFLFESSSLTNHLPGCPFSQFVDDQHTEKFTIEFGNLKWLLQKAVSVSFSLQKGAGGFSISPMLTYSPTVDNRTAPAFRIMNLFDDIMWTEFNISSDLYLDDIVADNLAKVIEYGFDEVISLYRHRKASPRDIDSEGRTLIHYLLGYIACWYDIEARSNIGRAFLTGINKLIASGLPAAAHDAQDQTPAGMILFSGVHSDFFPALASLLVSVRPDCPLTVSLRAQLWRVSFSECLDYYHINLSIAEAANCGPLSLAAITGNEHTVSNLLNRYPETCREVNVFGQTPVHLAVLHPACLRLIVAKSDRSTLDNRDKLCERALDYAARAGYEESIIILIEHQCSIDSKCIQKGSQSRAGMLVSGLRNRRDHLKAFAVRHLSELESARLNLGNNNTLDRNAKQVQQILHDKGIKLPNGLDASTPGFRDDYSVFHLRLDIQLFDVLWEHKFRDIDSLDSKGKPPLLVEPLYNLEVGQCYSRYRWLIEHGADLWMPFSMRSTTGGIKDPVTPAHFLFATIGRWWDADFGNEGPPNIEVVRFLSKELLSTHVSDNCSCNCTTGGCTPLAMFLRFLAWEYDDQISVWYRCFDNPQALAGPLVRFIQEAQPKFTMEQHLAVVRKMTHEALDITHTCCRFSIINDYESRHLTPEEVEEINSEQIDLLELLDDLVVEFEQISQDDRNGQPLGLCDPDEFWTCHWVKRMNAVLEGLDGNNLNEKERSGANAIGVVWDTSSTTSSESEFEPDRTPEYFLERLEGIIKEHR